MSKSGRPLGENRPGRWGCQRFRLRGLWREWSPAWGKQIDAKVHLPPPAGCRRHQSPECSRCSHRPAPCPLCFFCCTARRGSSVLGNRQTHTPGAQKQVGGHERREERGPTASGSLKHASTRTRGSGFASSLLSPLQCPNGANRFSHYDQTRTSVLAAFEFLNGWGRSGLA